MEQHSARTSDHGPDQGRSSAGQGRPAPEPAPVAAAGAASGGPAGPSPAAARTSSPTAEGGRRRRGADGAGRDDRLAGESATVYRTRSARPRLPAALSWLPRSRLTALGSGVLAIVLMLVAGGIDALLLGGAPAVYGVLFVLGSALCVAWVRPADLFIAPVSAPIAFTVGLALISGGPGNGGLTGHLVGLFPALAVNAFWLYGGTLAGLLVALVRKVTLIVQRSTASSGSEQAEGGAEEAR